MTTAFVIDSLNRAARQCGVALPLSWVGAASGAQIEIREDFLWQTKEDILDRLDYPGTVTRTVLTGANGFTSTSPEFTGQLFTIAGGRRLVRGDDDTDPPMFDIQQRQGLIAVSGRGEWEALIANGASGARKYYRLIADDDALTFEVYPSFGATESFAVNYVTDNWVSVLIKGVYEADSEFKTNDDILRVPKRLIETGIVWRFRERRGVPYEDKFREYEAQMHRASVDSIPQQKVHFGDRQYTRWQDNIPAVVVIPS